MPIFFLYQIQAKYEVSKEYGPIDEVVVKLSR